ncbi:MULTISPECIES: hypothetical protein [unclassified Mesorhizobium]|uniref:hypothetical protein n=1 Tax=unclassified Mesorhizobium TaxID=325217 RepID=UPI00167A96A4|nr:MULTISPECIES: hypothetical protein [unclassified Mesorhizobium]MCQ8876379.1 hypothetical protein [Mesorhizobium sp. LMG17149]
MVEKPLQGDNRENASALAGDRGRPHMQLPAISSSITAETAADTALDRIDASRTRPRLQLPTLAAYLLQIARLGRLSRPQP